MRLRMRIVEKAIASHLIRQFEQIEICRNLLQAIDEIDNSNTSKHDLDIENSNIDRRSNAKMKRQSDRQMIENIHLDRLVVNLTYWFDDYFYQ